MTHSDRNDLAAHQSSNLRLGIQRPYAESDKNAESVFQAIRSAAPEILGDEANYRVGDWDIVLRLEQLYAATPATYWHPFHLALGKIIQIQTLSIPVLAQVVSFIVNRDIAVLEDELRALLNSPQIERSESLRLIIEQYLEKREANAKSVARSVDAMRNAIGVNYPFLTSPAATARYLNRDLPAYLQGVFLGKISDLDENFATLELSIGVLGYWLLKHFDSHGRIIRENVSLGGNYDVKPIGIDGEGKLFVEPVFG